MQGRLTSHRSGGPEIPESVDGATLPFALSQTSTSYAPTFAQLGRSISFTHSAAAVAAGYGAQQPQSLPQLASVPSAHSATLHSTPQHTQGSYPQTNPPAHASASASLPTACMHSPALVRSYSSHSYPTIRPWSGGGGPGPLGSQANSCALLPLSRGSQGDAAQSASVPLADAAVAARTIAYAALGVRASGASGRLWAGLPAIESGGSMGTVMLPLLPPEGDTHTHTTTFDTTAAPPLPPPDAASGEVAVLDRPLLEHALDNMHACDELFMGKFAILGPLERRVGGQGIVQFATAAGEPVAIKFFVNRKAFDCEAALYEQPHLRGMMPAVALVHSNDDVRPTLPYTTDHSPPNPHLLPSRFFPADSCVV